MESQISLRERTFQRCIATLIFLTFVVTGRTSFAGNEIPKAEYHSRRVQLASELHGGAALLFSADAPHQEYQEWRQDEDFFYLTGWDEPGAALLIEAPTASPSGQVADIAARYAEAGSPSTTKRPYREILFLPDRDTLLNRYTGEMPDSTTAKVTGLVGVDEVRPMSELTTELTLLSRDLNALYRISAATDQAKVQAAIRLLNASDGFHSLTPAVSDLRQMIGKLRTIKSTNEIALLQKAADASIAAHIAVLRATYDGQRERALSGLIDYELKVRGCERPSYPSIVASGVHSTTIHYERDNDTLHNGDLMLVDAAGECGMYASDISRTIPVNGHFTQRQREIYDIVLQAQQAAINSFTAGVSNLKWRSSQDPHSLDFVAWQYINTHGRDLHGEPLGKYFSHIIGHPVGISVHDAGERSTPLVPGSVFTIEPGVYLPDERIGIRIEDVFYVAADGRLVCLTQALPKDLDSIEAMMKNAHVQKR